MKRTTFLIVISITLFSACQNSSTLPENINDATVIKYDTTSNSESNVNQSNVMDEAVGGILMLNNGLKWQANAETTEGITKMQTRINGFLENGETNLSMLSESLENDFTTILQKCTMTGEAHEQLHNFLLPLKVKIEKLKETNRVENLNEIKVYLDYYNTYFE